ncbi:acyltransferase family protein [Metabacillus sp. 84]|uniref:acyltransferase family protein n=1 Tax=unclassified Metabacillus TaxID=2675274 RepID=UPI003CEB0FC4
MEISKNNMKMLKGVAILFMLLLHLFCRKDVNGLYETLVSFNGIPLAYYIGLFGDACVPIYCFASGYGLYISYHKHTFLKKNSIRILKLLINFWIILLLFMLIGFLAGKSGAFQGGLGSFLLNFFVLSNSYNGAWWFLQTYIILILLTPYIVKKVKAHSTRNVLVVSVVIYLISYIQRIKEIIDLDQAFYTSLINSLVLVGTSLFPFIVGCIFAKEKVNSKISRKFSANPYRNLISGCAIFGLLVLHSVYESMIVAPLTAIAFVCLFNLMSKGKTVKKVLLFFGDHSTNIWLTHMFFYMSIFPELTFAPRYWILVFIWLIALCLLSSYLINFIFYPIGKMVDRMIMKKSIESNLKEGKLIG